MFSRRLLAVSFGAVILAGAAAASADALTGERGTTYVKFSRNVALPGVELTAGTYIFERVDPVNHYIVRVLSRDRRHVYTTQVTNVIQRPANVSNDHGIILGEAGPGVSAPVQAWFPVGAELGHEFIYRR